MAWKKQTGTSHKEECTRVFSRYDLSCLRCIELNNGATPREGWINKNNVRGGLHTCTTSCTPVCTFGD